MTTVSELMIEDVYTTALDDTIFHAGQIMSQQKISCLVIVRDAKVIGIITLRDILDKVMLAGVDPQTTNVEKVMAYPVVTVEEHESTKTVAHLMVENHIKQIPVVRNDEICGIITQTDLVKNYHDIV